MSENLAKLLSAAPGREIQDCLMIRGASVHFRFIRGPYDGAPLIVRFHGAIQRDRRPLPAFQKNLSEFSGQAHQITICDPTMIDREGFSLSWYAGHEGLDTQSILLETIRALRDTLAPSRTLYLGSSGGGFAALFFSYHDPESAAIVMVPQTNVQDDAVLRKYMTNCWPGRSQEEVRRETCLDVTGLYSSGFENTVIYIQSQGDFKYNSRHLLPLLDASLKTGDPQKDRIILYSDYWGRPGHGGAVPPTGYYGWLRTALSSPTLDVEDLLETQATLTSGSLQQPGSATGAPKDEYSQSDFNMAKLVKSDCWKSLLRIKRLGDCQMTHPYKKLKSSAFWRASVGSRHFADIEDLWDPMELDIKDRIATAGSCFAQHIGRNLQRRGAHFIDVEPPVLSFSTVEEERRWGFGVYSARYGNIYTSRQLYQLLLEAHGKRKPHEIVWERDGRFFDALRPSVDPVGQETVADVQELREDHLAAVRRMFSELDVFVFTLGLTEGWESRRDGTIYPVAPGTTAGKYDARSYRFRNLRYSQIMKDMRDFWSMVKDINPKARMLLTVSPVPLAATASREHVLVASTYSKSVLRAVAGDLAADFDDISYFPSYEIITAPAARGMFYEPDLRNVNQFGVDFVMDHFFSGGLEDRFVVDAQEADDGELVCDEGRLDQSEASD